MIKLNKQQLAAVKKTGNVLLTACPGSGKTRVLMHRVLKELSEIKSNKHRVIAVTFTNRAADEIKSRLDDFQDDLSNLWAGTIHSFSLDWIIRPYSCYLPALRKGFTVADEYHIRRLINRLKEKYHLNPFEDINTKLNRNGNLIECSATKKKLLEEYYTYLKENKLIDFDMVLFYAYTLVNQYPEISKTLASIICSICIDEYQDTQDLQYGILAKIVKASNGFTRIFVVGDKNQAIYSSLGGIAKNAQEIKKEFGIDQLNNLKLTGNYRSTQQIIDLSFGFQDDETNIVSLADYANENGNITFNNQDCHKDNLPEFISTLISKHIANGVPPHEICILAPQWWMITSLGRQLVTLLPDVNFDAPGLSPLDHQKDNIWYKIARLFLMDPEPELYRTRLRLARSVVNELEQLTGTTLTEEYRTARKLLRLTNSISSNKFDGIQYLEDVFHQLLLKLRYKIDAYPSLNESWNGFFERAHDRLNNPNFNRLRDIKSLKKMFKKPGGVIVTSCHSIKGEEYETVICFGMLKGYIPNWRLIIDETADESIESKRLLYVIISRAKKNLHLISECGRHTNAGNPYETNCELEGVCCESSIIGE